MIKLSVITLVPRAFKTHGRFSKIYIFGNRNKHIFRFSFKQTIQYLGSNTTTFLSLYQTIHLTLRETTQQSMCILF